MPRPLSRPSARTAVRAAAAAAALVLLLVGCGGDEDVTEAQFSEDLQEATGNIPDTEDPVLPESVADCFAAKVFDEFPQQEINRIYHAADEDELGNTTRDKLNQLNQECFTEYTDAAAAGDESTTTTAGDDEDGSTTTAAETTTEAETTTTAG